MNYVIETELPDGIHWFGGLRTKSIVHPAKGLMQIPYNYWTPYKNEALLLDNYDKATETKDKILQEGYVIEEHKAKFHLSYYEYEKGIYLGPKRVKNIQPGDYFSEDISTGIRYKCLEIQDKKIICQKSSITSFEKLGKHIFSAKSNKWVWVIYDTNKVKEKQNN